MLAVPRSADFCNVGIWGVIPIALMYCSSLSGTDPSAPITTGMMSVSVFQSLAT
jgi:hypothetical protein